LHEGSARNGFGRGSGLIAKKRCPRLYSLTVNQYSFKTKSGCSVYIFAE
jgi:hypothetical protein